MKKLILAVLMPVVCAISVKAQLPITKLSNATPTDMVSMDMATDAAKSSVKQGGAANGAVIVVNGQVIAAGTSSADKSAEENAVAKSGRASLEGASVYTVNQPSVPVYLKLSSLGVSVIYFVNRSDVVVAAGLLPASSYELSVTADKGNLVPLISMPFPEAQRLLKK